jgi:diketogulonate reductase-like aldo/keto reductase
MERPALVVAVKVGSGRLCVSTDVERACRRSHANLRLDSLDLYYHIRWPVADGRSPPRSTEQTWRAMEGFVDAGLIRSIGAQPLLPAPPLTHRL